MKFLDNLIKMYGDDCFVYGSYMKHLLLGKEFRDVDIILMDTTENFTRMLDEAGLEYTRGIATVNPMLVRTKFVVDDQQYDVCTFRIAGMSHDGVKEFIGAFPNLIHTIYMQNRRVSHSPKWLELAEGRTNPDFDLKWFNKEHLLSKQAKYGRVPHIPASKGKHASEGRARAGEVVISIYGRKIPAHKVGSPYALLESDIWVSRYKNRRLPLPARG